MKFYTIILLSLISFLPITILGQSKNNCAHCNMVISNPKFKAIATQYSGKVISFDAIECLVNYQKSSNKIKNLKVTNYNNGKLIDAKNAFYVKSKEIPSPMGAFLSAYNTKKEALKVAFGTVMNWKDLVTKFENSNFGAIKHSHHNHHRSDAHAPIGVMGDHLHPKGGLMVSLRTMHMKMDGNRKGSNKVDDQEIFQKYTVAPQNMSMQMHMLGVMYAPSNKVTLMAMQNFVIKKMDLTAQMTMPNGMLMQRDFSTKSSGFGDLKLGALYSLWSSSKTSAHLNSSINIPVGDITNKDDTPMMDNAKLPYAMQLGSGTFDFIIGATLKGKLDNWTWGAQQLNTIRTGKNSENYRFGNLYQLNLWSAYSLTPKYSISVRLQGTSKGTISGNDTDLNPMMVTTADTNNYGGKIVKTHVGFNGLLFNKLLFGLEIGVPIYQKYNNFSMNETLTINGGIKYSIL